MPAGSLLFEATCTRGGWNWEKSQNGRAFIRFESAPGEDLQVDWGHFGSLTYGSTKRKLYALAVIESYSRMLYIEFTHSQRQRLFHQGLLNALPSWRDRR